MTSLTSCFGYAPNIFKAMSDTTPEHTGSYCNTDIFRAQCPEGWVVMMTSAWYGRMKIGKCVKFQIGSGSCGRDVLLLVDRRCSGKRMCDIRIPDAELESSKPCGKELKNYLEASYVCLRVETVTSDECQSSTNLQVTFASGYLGSIINSDTPHCDGAYHPWVIKGQPGQRVNLTLYDFALDAATFVASIYKGYFHDVQQRSSMIFAIDEEEVREGVKEFQRKI
ncbi:hypothetical protein HELRODRAFT_159334 [Helobdella robusta]|uniref:SUEL-type lectin domain-containing protein n=1 Tax=Helobdella robusta TaxID=6412 RepID=T1ENW5_HELRO|nr:hypothetical protein HELRODRAFT_159334 [Helobdella robusta]ESO12751.1 hypothetical protein HELRODRAFT_159334 [Helobdella robusta]